VARDWSSPVADVDFRTKDGRTEIDKVHGTGGVIIRGASQRAGGPEAPSRMTAEDVTGVFGAEQQLSELVGAGHANLEQTTAAGARQVTSGDRIDAHFVPASATGTGRQQGSLQIQVAAIDGHVSLMQQEPAKAGQAAPAPLRATAKHALYEGDGEWLHLTENPRIEDGGLELTANRVDVSQASGDAFAHGNVKATWIESGKQASEQTGTAAGGIGLGGDEPVHVIAAEAQLRKTTGEATFRGDARLWQGANSISAPSIVLNRTRQTLMARGSGTAQPVNVVMLSANGPEGKPKSAGKPATPAVVRVRAGDLKYSSAERKAVLKAEGAGSVLAQTEGATVSSSEVELTLLPPGNHAGPEGRAAQVDRMTARGHVVVSSQGRRGIGEKLVYTSDSGEYVLTGTTAAPPRMTDPSHGTVSGNALIFNTRDDSVSIEGQGQKTSTQTVAPR
jgi:lipopolysaccharide export system protein LptA